MLIGEYANEYGDDMTDTRHRIANDDKIFELIRLNLN